MARLVCGGQTERRRECDAAAGLARGGPRTFEDSPNT